MTTNRITQFHSLFEQCLSSGTSFVINILMVKILGLEQYGIFASLIIFLHLLLSLVQALVIQPMQVHIIRTNDLFVYRFFLIFLQSFFIFLIIISSVFVNLAHFHVFEFDQVYLLPFLSYLTVFLFYDFYRKCYLAEGKTSFALIMGITHATLSIGLLSAAWLGYFSGGLTTFLYLLAAGYLPALIMATAHYSRQLAVPDSAKLAKYLRIHLIDGQWLLYSAIIQWLSGNLYVLLSGVLLGLEALGVLRFVQSLLGLVNILLQTIENTVIPQLSQAYAISLDYCYRSFQKILGVYQWSVLGLLIILFVFAEPIITLAGNDSFSPYAYVLRGMILLYALIIIAYPIRLLIRIAELNKYYFTAYFISLAFSLASYRFLLSNYHVSGAIAGLIVNQLILQITWLVVLQKKQFNVWKLYTSYWAKPIRTE